MGRFDVPRIFALYRVRDPTGVSGTGVVAWGVRLPGGKAVLQWTGATTGIQQVSLYDSVSEIEHIHGHDGQTRVIWMDNPNGYGPH